MCLGSKRGGAANDETVHIPGKEGYQTRLTQRFVHGWLPFLFAIVLGLSGTGVAPANAGPEAIGAGLFGTAAEVGHYRAIARDITYCTMDGVALTMDIYYPQTIGAKPAPVAVYVHGGAWMMEDKTTDTGIADIPELVRRGYLVAAVNYRLAPRHRFPAQIEDVKCAIRYLRAHAAMYGLDPNRIGAWGPSAGGQLAALLGLTGRDAGFDVGEHADQSSRVQAVVDMYGPADMTRGHGNVIEKLLGFLIFGTVSPQNPIFRRASPVTYITPDDAPFLIIQGEKDRLVPPAQSLEFHARLLAAGVPASLVLVRNAGHGFSARGGEIEPSRAELTTMLADFFDRYLR